MKILLLILLLSPVFAEEDPDKELKELQKHAQDMEGAVQKAMGILEPLGGAEQIQKKALSLASDKKLHDAAASLWKHPNRDLLFYFQAIFFFGMIFFKAWRLSKSTHWFRRFISSCFYNVVIVVGLSAALPVIILGEPFITVVRSIWALLTS